jgi:hypothetical protein
MLFDLIGIAFRLLGLTEWFQSWRSARAARKQSQYEANTPRTETELEDAQRRGDF